jgi:glucose-1-phosphatase
MNKNLNPGFTNIKNIIFDLGKVLLNLDFDASIRAFQHLGARSEVLDDKNTYSDPIFYELEVGAVTPDEFRNQVRKMLKNPEITNQQIDEAWCSMILDVPENRVKVVQELRKKYNVYLFSNTNKIHIDKLHAWFENEYGFAFSSLFLKDYYSFEIHGRKPDVNAYKKVIQLSEIIPEETLFVDDLERNIESARKAGLKTLWLKEGMEMADIFSRTISIL